MPIKRKVSFFFVDNTAVSPRQEVIVSSSAHKMTKAATPPEAEYKFVEVSGHNLETSYLRFPYTMFALQYKSVSNHHFLKGGGGGGGVVKFVVLRVEDGSLYEITEAFLDLVKRKMVRPGSLVMLG